MQQGRMQPTGSTAVDPAQEQAAHLLAQAGASLPPEAVSTGEASILVGAGVAVGGALR